MTFLSYDFMQRALLLRCLSVWRRPALASTSCSVGLLSSATAWDMLLSPALPSAS